MLYETNRPDAECRVESDEGRLNGFVDTRLHASCQRVSKNRQKFLSKCSVPVLHSTGKFSETMKSQSLLLGNLKLCTVVAFCNIPMSRADG